MTDKSQCLAQIILLTCNCASSSVRLYEPCNTLSLITTLVMPGRKQHFKRGKAHSTFFLLLMSLSMHTNIRMCSFFSTNLCTRNQCSHLLACFLKRKARLLRGFPSRCLDVQVCAQAKSHAQAQTKIQIPGPFSLNLTLPL